jgi:hypothetical protein
MTAGRPDVRRDGDCWSLTWAEIGVGFGIDRLRDASDGLKGELTAVSVAPGANGVLAGPVILNLLSTRSQVETANKLEKRANGSYGAVDWDQLISQACAVVAKEYRAPAPLIDLDAVEDIEEVDYLIPGLVPAEETTVLYGDGESAKSLTAMRIAYSVSMNIPLPWGGMPAQTGNVLYLDWETNPRTVALRFKRLAAAEGTGLPKIKYRQCFRSITDELPSVREDISKHNICLVVVDSIGYAATGSLTEDDTARVAMNAMRQMSPATRLVVAHVSREAALQARGKVKPFGSAFFWNSMRSGIEVRRAEEDPEPDVVNLGLYHWKANDGEHHKPIALRVAFEGKSGPIAFDQSVIYEVPDLAARTSVSDRLYGLLCQGARDTRALAQEVDEKEDTVLRTLKRMRNVVQLEPGMRGKSAIWGLSAS